MMIRPPFLHGDGSPEEYDCWFTPSSMLDYHWRQYQVKSISCLRLDPKISDWIFQKEHFSFRMVIEMCERHGTAKTEAILLRLFDEPEKITDAFEDCTVPKKADTKCNEKSNEVFTDDFGDCV